MFGPHEKGTWSGGTAPNGGPNFLFLKRNQTYTVISEFRDHDGDLHPVGETWTFLGYSFYPYEDGMSFFVSLDGQREWHIRLQWRQQQQGPILDRLEKYIAPVKSHDL